MRRLRAIAALPVILLALPALAGNDDTPHGVLRQMVEAYRKVKSFEQTTVYTGDSGGMLSLVRSRLVVQKPNRALVELYSKVSFTPTEQVSRFLSDGRDYYIFQAAQNYYTVEAAPRDMKGLAELSMSIEMGAITGGDPFGGAAANLPMVMEAPTILAEVPVQVVAIDLSTKERKTTARLYIASTDHLLRRFAFDSEEIIDPNAPPRPTKPKTIEVDGEIIDVGEDETALASPPVHFAYENTVSMNHKLPPDTFKWVPPPGAGRFRPFEDLMDQSGKHDRGRPAKVARPKQLPTLQEYVEQMQRKNARRRR